MCRIEPRAPMRTISEGCKRAKGLFSSAVQAATPIEMPSIASTLASHVTPWHVRLQTENVWNALAEWALYLRMRMGSS
jgi:hypothetical protein